MRQCFADHGLLRRTIGGGNARCAAVLIDGRSTDKRENIVAIAQGIRKALQNDHPAAFGANVAVCLFVKCFAAAIRGHHVGVGESNGNFRGKD